MKNKSSVKDNFKAIFKEPLKKLIYYFSSFAQRDEALWVVGAHKQVFACNPKYFFISVSTNPDINVRCVWISRDKKIVKKIKSMGFRAEYTYSLKGALTCLKAKYYFVNCNIKDINFTLSNGACYINMWHGIPLKVIHDESPKALQKKMKRQFPSAFDKIFNPEAIFNYDYILSPSQYVTEYSLLRTFDLKNDRYFEYGYPRNDILFQDKETIERYIRLYCEELIPVIESLMKGSKVFLYAPTWRDTDEDFISLSKIDFVKLNEWLMQTNSYFLLKLHPSTSLDFQSLKRLERISVLDSKVDIYPLLTYIDVLITDYSSIYFDFLLVDRPIIFFPFDLESYIAQCRELYFDYLDVTPGVKAYSFEELMSALKTEEPSMWTESRYKIRERFWEAVDGGSSDKLASRIVNLSLNKSNL